MDQHREVGAAQLPTLTETLKDNPLYLDCAVPTSEAAEITGLSAATLETMRCRGGGPRFLKRGTRVLYRRRDLLDWLALGQRASTSDTGVD